MKQNCSFTDFEGNLPPLQQVELFLFLPDCHWTTRESEVGTKRVLFISIGRPSTVRSMLSRKANCLNTRCITVAVDVFLCKQNVRRGQHHILSNREHTHIYTLQTKDHCSGKCPFDPGENWLLARGEQVATQRGVLLFPAKNRKYPGLNA